MRHIVCVLIGVMAALTRAQDPAALMAQAARAHSAKDYAKCVELSAAAIEAGAFPPPAFYNAACCSALDGKAGAAFDWLDKAIEAGWRDAPHMKADPDLLSLHADERWTQVIERAEEAAAKFQPALREELLKRMADDQRVRMAANLDMAEWAKIDADNLGYMKALIDKHGWPGYGLVGDDGAMAAFVLVQHAYEDHEFQKKCLALLTEAVSRKDAPASDMALLTDRVLMFEGKPQIYGSQFRTVDGKLEMYPVEDEANLDARRKLVGLPPMAEYVKQMQARFGGN